MGVRGELKTSWYYLTLPIIITVGYFVAYELGLPFVVIWFIFGVIPRLDEAWSKDWLNPTVQEIIELEKMPKFKVVLYLSLILDWVALILASQEFEKIAWYDIPPLLFLIAMLNSMSFLVAHELFHKQNFFDKFFGTLHMIKNFYMHFTIQHLYGHHKKVATPDDPATSQKGMTLYQFLPKSIIGSYISAFKINPIFTTLTTIGSFLFFSLMYKVGGLFLLAIAFLSGFGGALVLQVINYIEHYGLERKRNADGSYERVTIRHSWNAPHRFTNYMFYKLQRHSDHHENSLKPYQTLCSYEDSPQLPHGYIGCVIIAIFPSVWFDMMDPLVDEYKQSDKGVNLKSLKIAEHKAENLISKSYKYTGILAIIELLVKVAIPAAMALPKLLSL